MGHALEDTNQAEPLEKLQKVWRVKHDCAEQKRIVAKSPDL